jgi:DNA-binding HxlR family transcriptional regulator
MRRSKIATQQSANLRPRYCPYCGRPNLSIAEDRAFCLECGASFRATRVSQDTKMEVRKLIQSPKRRNIKDISHILSRSSSPTSAFKTASRYDLSEFEKALNTLRLQDDVRQEARRIYIRASTAGMRNGRTSGEALASASVYAACRQNELSNTLEEIASAFGADKAEVEHSYALLLNEIGFLSQIQHKRDDNGHKISADSIGTAPDLGFLKSEVKAETQGPDVTRFLEKKGTFEFLRLLKERPKRWKTLEKELAVSPRTLSERITQALELGYIEKVRRLKIGATYYRLTKKGLEIFETMTESTSIY